MDTTNTSLAALISSAANVIDNKGLVRINGKVASIRTVEYSKQVIFDTCRRLHALGYFLLDISALKEKHIEVIVKDWYARSLSNKTMQNQLSRLRIFAGWLGKPEIMKAGGVPAYLEGVAPATLKVKTFSEESKSWTGNGVDVVKVINKAKLEDSRVYGMLLLGVSFGLRKKEMLRIRPWKADVGNALRIDGSVAKNGRFRSIPIDMDQPYGRFQRWCLDQSKLVCTRSETLGWPDLTFKQSENRFYHFMSKFGITKIDSGVSAHGLRAEFAENMALIMGLVPPSLGGQIDQMGVVERKEITSAVSNVMGHDGDHAIGAYFSTFRPVAKISGVGGKVGMTIVVDLENNIFATVNVNPTPIRAPDGSYRIQTQSERSQTAVTCILEIPPGEHEHMGVVEFVKRYPQLGERVKQILVAVGLGE